MSTEPPAEPPGAEVEHTLSDPTVMRALAHPVRTALLELLSVMDTITATQASEILGESPANCAFHLRTLGKYGFAREAGGGRGRQRPWTASGPAIRLSVRDQTDPQAALAAETLGRVWLEQWLNRARVVYGNTSAASGWDMTTKWNWEGVYLTAEEAESVMREIRAIVHRYSGRQHDPALRPPGALPVEWAIFSAPIPEIAHLAAKDGGPADTAPGSEDSQRGEANNENQDISWYRPNQRDIT